MNGTDYTVRVSVTTNYGTAQSEEITRAPAPGPAVADISFSNIGQTSATAIVAVANAHLAIGSLTTHLRYRVAGTTNWGETSRRAVSNSSSVFSLTGLTGNTLYEVEASLTGDFDNSVIRELLTAKSPPHAPESLVLANSDQQLRVSWNAPTNDGGDPVTGYTVQWKSGNQLYSTSRQQETDANTTSVDITELINGTEYMVRVFATNLIGDGIPAEAAGTPSTVPLAAGTSLLASPCDGSLHLSWRPPQDDGGSPITSYNVQWKSASDADYDENVRQQIHGSADPMYTLTGLDNLTAYAVRIRAANIKGDATTVDGDAIWSQEVTGTPRPGACLLEVRFGNPLANSVPAYVTVKDADAGTNVYLRHRQAAPGSWLNTLIQSVQLDQTTVTFDIRGLLPETSYEVEVSLDPGISPTGSTIRAFFTSGVAATGPSGPRSGTFARILRIEPAFSHITVVPGDTVVFGVEIYGRQDIHDNNLADRAPANGRPTFTWTSQGGGSFDEAALMDEWLNKEADDREVIYLSPSVSGTYEVKAALLDPGECQGATEDETAQDAEDRCTAVFIVRVSRPARVQPEPGAPVNPVGPIPEKISDPAGQEYGVFTPEEGGIFTSIGYSLKAAPGAVANDEFIGMNIVPIGDAINAVNLWQRYTLVGKAYAIGIIDSSGSAIAEYSLGEPATVCVPLPEELRGKIADVVLTVVGEDGDLIALSSNIKIASDGTNVCGALSAVPATVAVGSVGASAADTCFRYRTRSGRFLIRHRRSSSITLDSVDLVGAGCVSRLDRNDQDTTSERTQDTGQRSDASRLAHDASRQVRPHRLDLRSSALGRTPNPRPKPNPDLRCQNFAFDAASAANPAIECYQRAT